MKRKIYGIFMVLMALVFMGCTNSTTDTPTADTTITLLAIPGVTAPVRGANPVTTAIDTAQYTGIISWSPADNSFSASTVYTANITLTAKAGYTLTGVAANSFTVAGATATNAANTGAVTAVFPATGAVLLPSDYTSANIGTLKGVPAGTFQRDSTATNTSYVSAFRMSQYEITRAQYTAVTGATDPSDIAYSTGMTDPVQNLTWYDAVEFCNKLSDKEGLTEVYSISDRSPATGYPITAATVTVPDWSANGYRLPTEMEWMWAAMGATAGTTGYSKAFAGSTGSNAIGDYTWYSGNVSDNKSRPVGGKLPNELGLYDMSGNVWEFNWDWDGTYPTGAQTDYRGTASGAYRILRGGSWGAVASYSTVVYRNRYDPILQHYSIGFRVVRP